jgi:hypothetical protein
VPFDRKLLELHETLLSVGGLQGEKPPAIGRWTASLDWQSTGSNGILIDPDRGYWKSGRVLSLLPLQDGGILVGSESGGAWVVASNGASLGVSNDWDHPDVLSLAHGPRGPEHIYAGCDGSLYETDVEAWLPLLAWREIGSGGRKVYSIAISASKKAIVIATDDGVWSAPTGTISPTWRKAAGLPPGGYSSVALTENGAILAAAWGSDTSVARYGIFIGTFKSSPFVVLGGSGSYLDFKRAEIIGLDQTKMGRISIASSRHFLDRAYAIVADATNDGTLAVLRSNTGGRTWFPLTMPISIGGQAARDQCIAVAPSDPDRVVIGGRTAGPVISRDGGSNWKLPHEGGKDTTLLHSDLNALAFDPEDGDSERLFVGSDGGVVVTSDLGETLEGYNTELNRGLATMQFLREPFWTSSGSPWARELYGGGLQDNGNIYQHGEQTEWRLYEGGDGHCMLFLLDGALLRFNNDGFGARISFWNGAGFDDGQPGHPTSGFTGAFEPKSAPVDQPQFRNEDGDLLVAVGGQGEEVFGLFDQGGRQLQWRPIARLIHPRLIMRERTPLSIEGIGSLNGDLIYVGTSQARMFAVETGSGNVTELTVAVSISGSLNDFHVRSPLIVSDKLGFALLYRNGGAAAIPCIPQQATGVVLRSRDLVHWEPLTTVPAEDGPIYTVAADWAHSPGALYAGSDAKVWVSYDAGDTWGHAGRGLPRRSHCADLRLVRRDDGSRWLYLATYGRSVWRTRVFPQEDPAPPGTRTAGPATQVASVGRDGKNAHIFWIGGDGAVTTAQWNADTGPGWGQPTQISPANSALPGSPLSAIARTASHLDVFWVGADGAIETNWWDSVANKGEWPTPYKITGENAAVPGSSVCVVSQQPRHLDVLWSGPDGTVMTTWWDEGTGAWAPAYPISNQNSAIPGACVAASSSQDGELVVAWVSPSGAIVSNSWSGTPPRWWGADATTDDNVALPGSHLACVARAPGRVDVYWIATDGAVWTNWTPARFTVERILGGPSWSDPFTLTEANGALPGSPISCLSRAADHIDLAWTDTDGRVNQMWWDREAGAWDNPHTIAGALPSLPGGPISAASRHPRHLDLYWVDADGAVVSSWLDAGKYGGPWSSPFRVTPARTTHTPDHVDVFYVGQTAEIESAWWDTANPSGAWSNTFPVTPPDLSAATAIAAVSRSPDNVELFYVDENETLKTTGWDRVVQPSSWSPAKAITNANAVLDKGPIATVARNPDHIDVFFLDPTHAVATTWWERTSPAPPWAQPFRITNEGAARTDSPLAAVSCTPSRVDLFFISPAGAVMTTSWDWTTGGEAWTDPRPITADAAARPGSQLAAVAPNSDRIHVFFINSTGRVRMATRSRVTGWSRDITVSGFRPVRSDSPLAAVAPHVNRVDFFYLKSTGMLMSTTLGSNDPEPLDSTNLTADAAVPAGATVAATTRSPNHIDVFWIAGDGSISSMWWDARVGWSPAFAVTRPGSSGLRLRASVRTGVWPPINAHPRT